MAFRLRNDAEKMLKHLLVEKSVVKTMFDLYYLCFMVGLACGRTNPDDIKGVAPFIQNFPEDYQSVQDLLVGLLVMSEIRKNSIDLSNKTQVRSEISRLIHPSTSTGLTSDGHALMNAYASGGFDFMLESHLNQSLVKSCCARIETW